MCAGCFLKVFGLACAIPQEEEKYFNHGQRFSLLTMYVSSANVAAHGGERIGESLRGRDCYMGSVNWE